jgi:hypothetical protein
MLSLGRTFCILVLLSSFSYANRKFFQYIYTVLDVKQWGCFNLFHIYVHVSLVERYYQRSGRTQYGKDSAYTHWPHRSPSLCSAGCLLSIITASLTDPLIWLPVEICVKEWLFEHIMAAFMIRV